MPDKIQITVVMDNQVHRQGLTAEHGLSIHVVYGRRSILFDTGQTNHVLRNAQVLGLALNRLDAIVLSHGHYDHSGALAELCQQAKNARIFMHPTALCPRYSAKNDGPLRPIGLSPASRQAIDDASNRLVYTSHNTTIEEGIHVTGAIPRVTPGEDAGGRFFLDEDCRQPDPVEDDQALFLDTPDGVVVLLGCAHAGAINSLLRIEQLASGRPVVGVLGGLHLHQTDENRLATTIQALQARNPRLVVAMHCTGWQAMMRLQDAFPGHFAVGSVGSRFCF
jgi:7,8-dihydropterin-6-yl-methyl-4-(beta-D-ribofuranosyl)aminobenzene 5'-phosphate synthase